MDLNPYAAQLGNRNPREVIAATPARLRKLIQTLGVQRVNQAPQPGKWSPREIACHLADCEVAFAFRLRQAIAEDNHVVQPFDQNKWAKSYSGYNVNDALAAFTALRHWNISLVAAVPKEALGKKFSHPERGEMTLNVLVETMAGHDLNHLKQLEAIAAK